MNKAAGVILITVGIILMVWAGFTFSPAEKTKKHVSVQLLEEPDKAINWPLYSGGFLLAGGIVIIIMSKKEDKIW